MDFRLLNIALILPILLGLASCGQKTDVRTLRLAHGLPVGHPVHQAMEKFGEVLDKKSNGKFKIKIYPSNQLGGERECLELLQIGSLDITKVSAATLENFNESYKVFNLPYLFDSQEHRMKVLDGDIGMKLLSGTESIFLKGLCFYDAGSRSFYSVNNQIATPEDLKGLKIRVMKSKTAVEMVNNMGGSATPIDFGELYSALQQGVVDGAENNPPSFYTSKHYEVCKYYTLDEHTSVPDVLVLGTKTWEKLSDQEKKWIKEAALESVPYQRKLWADFEDKSLSELKKAGVQVLTPDKSAFAEKTKAMFTKEKLGDKVFQLYQDIRQIAN